VTAGIRGSGFGIRDWVPGSREAAAAFALLMLAAVPALAIEVQQVTFAARDGVQVTGSLYLPDRRPAPAVVLLPMLGRTRRDWDTAAARLAEAGIAALAIDFRQGGGAQVSASGAPGGGYAALVLDASAARAYLAARPEVNPARIGVAGASLGANVAVLAAADDPAVRSLALLSVSGDYRGLMLEQALRKFGSRPALLVTSNEDPYALRSSRQAVTMGGGPRELRVLSGAGHGTAMLAGDPDLASALVDWFVRTLL
jgi:dienelactone hydrolase